MELNRRLLIIASATALVVLMFGFGLGRLSVGTADVSATGQLVNNASGLLTSSTDATSDTTVDGDTTTTTLTDATGGDPTAILDATTAVDLGDAKVYGDEADRGQFFTATVLANVIGGTRDGLLATGDHICYTLERMQAQNRSPSFAVRVVWNESLADMRTEDLAAFAFVFRTAPGYLCPESLAYAEKVSYWLGF